jgi:hypothetical protein
MYPHSSSYSKTPDAWTSHVLDTIHACGLNAGQAMAAEERHQEAQQYAAQWIATHPTRERTPRAWRQWSGKLLVRAENRLEGGAPRLGAEIQPAIH